MSGTAHRTGAVLLVMAFAVFGAACGSSGKQAAPASTTTTASAPVASTAASTSTTKTSSTPPSGSSAATTTLGPQTGWAGPSRQADGTVPVAAFNAILDTSHATWTHSPLRTSVEFLQFDDTTARSTTVRVTTNPDSRQQADVIVTADGLGDDSVRATRYELHLARQSDASWRLASARWSQQCQPNRGHQDYTPELCV